MGALLSHDLGNDLHVSMQDAFSCLACIPYYNALLNLAANVLLRA